MLWSGGAAAAALPDYSTMVAMSGMTKRARMDSALAGDAVDRIPLGAWWCDATSTDGPSLAAAALDAFHRFDWDWATVLPDWTLVYEAWGSSYDRGGGAPRLERAGIRFPDTLLRMRFLDPRKGALGEQADAIRRVRLEVGDDTPVLIVVPSPMVVLLELMADREETRRYLVEHGRHAETGVGIVMETLAVHAGRCVEAGADGVILDVGPAATLFAGAADYRSHARPSDLYVLSRAEAVGDNVLRLGDDAAMLEAMIDYPVRAFGLSSADAASIDALRMRGRAVMGGLAPDAFVAATPDDAVEQARAIIRSTGGRRLLLAPHGTLSGAPSEAVVDAVRDLLAAEGASRS